MTHPTNVQIPDPDLAAEIRKELDLPADAPLSLEAMQQLTRTIGMGAGDKRPHRVATCHEPQAFIPCRQ